MKRMTCDQVNEQIDLHAAGECAPALAADIERHLDRCPACRRQHDAARNLMARLDWQFREPAALTRLLEKLPQQAVRPRTRLQPWTRRALALAASVFFVLILAQLQPASVHPEEDTVLAVLQPSRNSRSKPEMAPPEMMRLAHGQSADRAVPLDPAQPLTLMSVHLQLTLTNTEKQTLYLHPDDPRTRLHLELEGPGVQRQQPGPGSISPTLIPRQRSLPVNASTTLAIPWLIDGSRQHPRYLFCTVPGTYTLTIHYHVPVSVRPDDPGEPRIFSSRALTLQVQPR